VAEVRWDDLVRGAQHVDEAARAIPSWCAPTAPISQLHLVVDDIAMAITI